jgi:peptidyl-prolyl cis-trans isomerase D
MLKTMRKNVQSLKWVLWFVVAAFIISIFVIWGGAGRLGEAEKAGQIAEIGKEKITAETYFNALRNRIESLKTEFKELNRQFLEQLNIPQQVLEQMIEQALLFDLADEWRLRASDEEVKDRIIALPGLQRDGVFVGYADYKRALANNRISVSDFENSLRREIVLNKAVQVLTAGITATPDEVWESYKKTKDSAKIEFLALEKSKVETGPKPGEAEVRAYFDGHKDAYKIPEKREGLYVFLKNDDLKKEVELSDSEIEKYYKDNSAQFEVPEKIKVSRIWLPFAGKEKAQVEAEAQNVLDRLRKGEDFAGLAKTFSKDAKSKEGGDWGYYDWQTLPPKEQEEIKKLEAGRTSAAVAEDDGLAIIRVAEKTPPAKTALAEARPQIRTILLDQRARELAAERIGKIEKEAKRVKSLEAAAKASNLKAEPTGLRKSGEALGDLDPSGSLSTALFQLKEKEISAPVYAFSGVGLVEMAKTEAPRPAAFEEVMADVEKDLEEVRKKDKTLATIKEVRAKLTDKNWEDLASKYKLEIKTVDEHKREQYLSVIGESRTVDDLVFSLPLKKVSEPVEFENGYALIRVHDRKEGTKEEFAKEKEAEMANVLEQKKNKFLQAFLAQRRTDKGVKVNYAQFLQVSQDVLSRYETDAP